jgi:hypothetical protein
MEINLITVPQIFFNSRVWQKLVIECHNLWIEPNHELALRQCTQIGVAAIPLDVSHHTTFEIKYSSL